MFRVLPLLLILSIAACSKGATRTRPPRLRRPPLQQPAATSRPPAQRPGAGARQAGSCEVPDVVARVNGEDVSKTDVEDSVQNLEGRAGGPVPPDQRDRVYRGVLDQLIGYKLLLQEVKDAQSRRAGCGVDARIDRSAEAVPV